MIRFRKEKGDKGFRFDVVNLISKPEVFEDDHQGDGRRFYTDGPHVHEYLKELVRDTGIDQMVTVGEMSSTTLDNCIRYSNPEEKELSMCFNFHHLKVDYKDGKKWELMEPDLAALKKIFATWQEGMAENNGWNAVFWCNHDQPRIVSRLGDDKTYWKESAKMLAAAVHMMRGTPYIYQGEEIGMTNPHYDRISLYKDVESLNYYEIMLEQGKTKQQALEILEARSRDNSRTPMQWDGSDFAGFTQAEPWLSIPDNHRYINVESEKEQGDSILQFYRKLIQLRKEHTAISQGTIEFVETDSDEIMAYFRESKEEKLLVVCHMKDGCLPWEGLEETKDWDILLTNYSQESRGNLRPYEMRIYRKKY